MEEQPLATERQSEASVTTSLPDDPVTSPDEDLLEREPLARSIADMILSTPQGQSLRIGVYGDWGEGKTSVLKMAEARLPEECVCVWLVPWVANSRDEVISLLIEKLAVELDIPLKDKKGAEKKVETIDQVLGALGEANAYGKAFDRLFGRAIKDKFGRVEEAVHQLRTTIDERLKGRRVVVFVDDLDRVRPEFVPEILLTLRAALGDAGFSYVLALSPKVVEEGLNKVHPGWAGSRKFLEKVVELPFYLPEPTPDQRSHFVRNTLDALREAQDRQSSGSYDPLNVNALEAIADFLPRNPRKLKRLLRYVLSLRRLLERFDDGEIDYQAFYLCQTLRLEFPEESRRLVRDGKLEVNYAERVLRKHNRKAAPFGDTGARSKEDQEEPTPPEETYAPAEEEAAKERFIELVKEIRRRGTATGRFRLPELYNLPEDPPLFTLGETTRLIETVTQAPPPKQASFLLEELQGRGNTAAAYSELLGLLLGRYSEALSKAADADTKGKQREYLDEAKRCFKVLELLATELDGFQSGKLSADAWSLLFSKFKGWMHFDSLEIYRPLREAERALLKNAMQAMSGEDQLDLLDPNRLRVERRAENRQSPEMEQLVDGLTEELEDRAARIILKAFREKHGLDRLFAGAHGKRGEWLLFDPDGALYKKHKEELLDLAQKAQEDQTVQSNFLRYLKTLIWTAKGKSSLHYSSHKEAKRLLTDDEVVRAIWDAAVTQPLNPRTVGDTLRPFRNELVKEGRGDLVPLPSWWQRVEERGFWQDAIEADDADPPTRSKGEKTAVSSHSDDEIDNDSDVNQGKE